MQLLPHIWKSIAALLLVALPTLLLKKFTYVSPDGVNQLAAQHDSTEVCYFLGSSRTRSNINDSLMNQLAGAYRFRNLGLNAGTMLFNKVFAEKLFRFPGKKLLLVELSVINARVPENYGHFFSDREVLNSLKPLMRDAKLRDTRHIFWPLFDRMLMKKIPLRDDVKELLRLGKPAYKEIGYEPQNGDMRDSSLCFLNTKKQLSEAIHPLYEKLTSELIRAADKSGNRIVFFLSPAFLSQRERAVLTEAYLRLPADNRVHFRSDFLTEMQDGSLYSDRSHLNRTGSSRFSIYLYSEIVRRGWLGK
ncbi:MAG TPA: hypothetical protein VEB63_03270 [Chitinophagaceae bacterium]|nr:hypothetical protein [Chitinophagaceae bacterium]